MPETSRSTSDDSWKAELVMPDLIRHLRRGGFLPTPHPTPSPPKRDPKTRQQGEQLNLATAATKPQRACKVELHGTLILQPWEEVDEDEESDVTVGPVGRVGGEQRHVAVLHAPLSQLVVQAVLHLCNTRQAEGMNNRENHARGRSGMHVCGTCGGYSKCSSYPIFLAITTVALHRMIIAIDYLWCPIS